MSIQMVTAEEQYKKNPQIDRSEVKKILEWFEKQPHLPKATGIFCRSFSFVLTLLSLRINRISAL